MKMLKKSLFSGGLMLMVALLLSSCNEFMSYFDNPVSSYLSVGATDIVVPTGDTYQIKASTINSDKTITYKSSDPTIATVDANGVVKGIIDGEATITVSIEASEYYNAGQVDVKVAVKRPLTFEALEDGHINVSYFYGITLEKPIKYTVNGDKKNIKEITANTSIAVKKGDKVEFESSNDHTGEYRVDSKTGDVSYKFVSIQPQSKCAVYGNVMSMITPDGNYHINKKITVDGALCSLFAGDDSSFSVIPNSNILNHDTYQLLLPATTLAPYCYWWMFGYCTSLIEAPVLPATTLAPHCYEWMFGNCSSLKKAPELKAETLTDWCYANMFNCCSKLKYVKCLAKSSADRSVYRMLWGAATASTGEIPTVERDPDTYWYVLPAGYFKPKSLYVMEGWTITPPIADK